MQISKMVFNFVVLVAVASIAGTSNAETSKEGDQSKAPGCPYHNARVNYFDRGTNTNPARATASNKSEGKSTKAQKATKRGGHK